MGCCCDSDSSPSPGPSDIGAIAGLMGFSMELAGTILPLSLRLEEAKTRDPEVDGALIDQEKLKAYPEFFTRLSAEIEQVDESAAEELKQLGPESSLSSDQKVKLSAFAEKVKQLGSSSSPPDVKWKLVAESLVTHRQLCEEVLKSYTDNEAKIELQNRKADRIGHCAGMEKPVADLKLSLRNLQAEVKRDKPMLALRIEAGKAGEVPMGRMKVLNELAAGVEVALESRV